MIKLDANTQSYTALTEWAEDTIKFARINLGDRNRKKQNARTGKFRKGKINASGDLSKSLGYKLNTNKNSIKFGITGLPYADVVDGGRKKGKGIPLAPLKKWVKKKPIRLRNKDGAFVKMTEARINNFVGAVSFNAKKYGIKPTNFLKEALEDSTNKHEALFTTALSGDFEQQIEQIIADFQERSKAKREN